MALYLTPYCKQAHLKKKCKAKTCRSPIEVVTAEKVLAGPGTFSTDGSFARVMAARLLDQNPEWTAEQVDTEVRRRWSAWVQENQKRVPVEGPHEAEPVEVEVIPVDSFGFARTEGKTWFPASKKVDVMRAGRMQVVFMRTGEALLVPLEDWRPYSAELALELLRDKVANRGGFRDALKEMRDAMRSAEEGVTMPCSSAPAMGMARTVGGELSNQKLGVENRVNSAAFKSKIYRKSDGKFGCRNCPRVSLLYKSVASRHARVCGERPNVPQERSALERHYCSADDCTARFASTRELHSHYSSAHPGRRPVKCVKCRKTFKTSDNLRRHVREKHTVGKKYSCDFCHFTTARKCELGHHIERSHTDEHDLLMANNKADGQDTNHEDGQDMQEDVQEKIVEDSCQEKNRCQEDSCQEKDRCQEDSCQEKDSCQEDNCQEDSCQDNDCELQEEGILGRLQNQIRELRKRRNSLVPVELLQLSNLLEMREKARAAGLGSTTSKEVRGVLGSRGRKRAASPDRLSEPTRQSARLQANHAESSFQHEEVLQSRQAESSSQHEEVLERLLEIELLGEMNNAEEDADTIVNSMINELIDLALENDEPMVTEEGAGIKCTVCNKQFNRSWNLKGHMATMHSVPDEKVLCTRKYCTRQFTTMFDMVVHRRLCTFMCGGCGKEMRRDDMVNSHMRKCNGGGRK